VSEQPGQQISEEELRALEAEIDRIHVDDVILQTIVSLINLGARKGAVGAPPEAGIPADYEQLRTAIEAARGLLAVVEPRHSGEVGPIRDALSQLQMAYARGAGGAARVGEPPAGGPGGGGAGGPGGAGEAGSGGPAGPGESPEPQGGQGPGPAQRSGRLWVPGQ
jgi:hypothetical protein